jgi:hypothetical protein
MGMFDYVNVPITGCPYCGKEGLTDWQSKDGDCLLVTVEYWEVDNFYTHCDFCRLLVEYVRTVPKQPIPLEYYELKKCDS